MISNRLFNTIHNKHIISLSSIKCQVCVMKHKVLLPPHHSYSSLTRFPLTHFATSRCSLLSPKKHSTSIILIPKRFYPGGINLNVVVFKFKLNTHRINNLFNIYNKRFPSVLPEIAHANDPSFYKSVSTFFHLCNTKQIFFKHLRMINAHGQLVLTKEIIDADLHGILVDDKTKMFNFARIDLGIANLIINRDAQISGFIPISKELREYLDKAFKRLFGDDHEKQDETILEYKEVYNYLIMSLGKTLNIFRGHIKDQEEFLSRVKYVFGSIDYPMPNHLSKYFGPIALLQHNLTLITAHRQYDTSLLEKLSDGCVDAKTIGPFCSMLNIIEQEIMYKNLGLALKQNPKVKAHVINSDNPTLLSDYNKEEALASCHQVHPDFLFPIPYDDHGITGKFIRYMDSKANHDKYLSHSRLSIKQDFFKGSFKELKNHMQSYHVALKDIIAKSKITNPKHPYVRLLENLKTILKETTYNTGPAKMEALNQLLVTTLFNKGYKDLFVSIITDAGVDSNFKPYHEEFIQNAVKKIKDNIIPHEIVFPKDSRPDSEKIIAVVQELIKYFPEEEQTSMWHNFERFGTPLIKEK